MELEKPSGLLLLHLFSLILKKKLVIYKFCHFYVNILFVLFLLPVTSLIVDIVRSDVALDKQKGCKIAQHPDIMLELQREKAAQMHLVLLKEQFSNTYSNLILTGNRALQHYYY